MTGLAFTAGDFSFTWPSPDAAMTGHSPAGTFTLDPYGDNGKPVPFEQQAFETHCQRFIRIVAEATLG